MPPAATTPSRPRLTLDQLQGLARMAGNHSWTRWWAHWNHPQAPSQMAISLMDETGVTVPCRDLEAKGFEKVVNDRGFIVYVCDRVDAEGRPYISRL